MPSVCIHYGPELQVSPRQFADLAEELAVAIEHHLVANRGNVEIMSVQLAHPPLGRPVYIEIKARDNKARGEEALRNFIDHVDEVTSRTFGARCRIRYFCYADQFLAAAN